jgi:predicted nucleic acid-binding Zn ribbon protein
MRGGFPTGVGSLISNLLRGLDLESRVKEQMCILVWDEVVGERIASAAQPEFVRDGRLFVVTKSPVWANELTFLKAQMIEGLNRRVGGNIVKEIIFKAGRLPSRKPKPVSDDERPELEGIRLSELELESVGAAAREAGQGAEDVRRLLETALRIEKWKKAQGWTPCAKCGALQNDADGVCPICRFVE